jgi:hypothetical protein
MPIRPPADENASRSVFEKEADFTGESAARFRADEGKRRILQVAVAVLLSSPVDGHEYLSVEQAIPVCSVC